MATAQDALQPSWSPVKLVHVLKSVAPDLADQLEALGSVALVAMARNRKPDGGTEREQQVMRKALVVYAGSFAAHYDYSITTQELAEAGLLPEQPFMPSDRVEEKREPFGQITKHLRDRFDLQQEPNIAAQCRGAALMEAGLLLSEQTMSPLSSDDVPTLTHSQERFLDSEFVAIYW
jgi:hypothetical protein